MGGFPDGCRPAKVGSHHGSLRADAWLRGVHMHSGISIHTRGQSSSTRPCFRSFFHDRFSRACHDQACACPASIERSLHRQHPVHLRGEQNVYAADRRPEHGDQISEGTAIFCPRKQSRAPA